MDWSKAVANRLTDDADPEPHGAEPKNFFAGTKVRCFGLAGIVNGIFKVHEEFLNDRGPVGVKNSTHL